ncbi:MAG: hypothetical protein VYA84_21355 [Planctomycetota bacterium]|nr:hypothetical protein [Planctomycetota bacterium]
MATKKLVLTVTRPSDRNSLSTKMVVAGAEAIDSCSGALLPPKRKKLKDEETCASGSLDGDH